VIKLVTMELYVSCISGFHRCQRLEYVTKALFRDLFTWLVLQYVTATTFDACTLQLLVSWLNSDC